VKKLLSLLWVFLLVSQGCAQNNTPKPFHNSVWSDAQTDEFFEIIDKDHYLSLCDQKPLYQKALQNPSDELLTPLLMRYTYNLANGCIDTKTFDALQKKRRKSGINTIYEFYFQDINQTKIIDALKQGVTITSILKPYIPRYEQFELLSQTYHKLKKNKKTSPLVLKKIRLNIERTKLINPQTLNQMIYVNIPECKARIMEDDKNIMEFKVIVGKSRLQTPIFSSQMRYVNVNPQWNVPSSIVKKEIIPNLLKDPNYLRKNNLVVREEGSLSSKAVDPKTINWREYLEKNKSFPYRIIEPPSQKNVLGKVKFLFPNKYAVYMHDTQTKRLFKTKERFYSHGCIRVEKPVEMYQYLALRNTKLNSKTINTKYKSNTPFHFSLKEEVMVNTLYLTLYLDQNGELLEFKDIYGYDKIQKVRE